MQLRGWTVDRISWLHCVSLHVNEAVIDVRDWVGNDPPVSLFRRGKLC